jgi:hypothetical protein
LKKVEVLMSKEYEKIFRDLGIDKHEEEPLTDLELQRIFVNMEEGLLIS